MDMAQETTVASKVPAYEKEGLPGYPVIKGRFVSLDLLLRDETGKVITAPRCDCVENLISEHLGKTIEAVKLCPTGNMLLKDEFLDIVAFQYTGIGRLSLLDRRAAAAFAWMANSYYPPMKRRDRTVFPTALDDLPKDLQSPRLRVQMWKAFTEDKAIQAAGVLEVIFPEIEATVFEDGDGWFVAIDAGADEFGDVAALERVETILWMLSEFDVTPDEYAMRPYGAGLEVDLDKDEYIHRKAIRAFNAHTAQQRIEGGINAILAHLGHPGADGKENAPPTTAKRGKGIDALIQPTGKAHPKSVAASGKSTRKASA